MNPLVGELLNGIENHGVGARNSLDSFLDTILRSGPQIIPQQSPVHLKKVYGQLLEGDTCLKT
jgi:hypothetical protein